MSTDTIEIRKISADRLFDAVEFVVEQNFTRHLQTGFTADYFDLVRTIYEEEIIHYHQSYFFVAENHFKTIIGCVRTLKWNKINQLPIEKIFGLSVVERCHISSDSTVWHIGRFATRQGAGSIELFKQLIMIAISPICEASDSRVFAECDTKLLRTLSKMGIVSEIIGEPLVYLGSETVPVCIDVNSLMTFYVKHASQNRLLNISNIACA